MSDRPQTGEAVYTRGRQRKPLKISFLRLAWWQVIVTILLITLLMGASLFFIYRYNYDVSENAFEVYSQNLYSQLQQYSELYRNTADVFYSSDIQNAVFRNKEETSSIDTMRNLLNYIIEVNPAIDSLFVVAKNGTRLSFSKESDVYVDTIFSRYQQFPFYSNPEPIYSTIIPRVSEHEKPLLFYLFSFSNLEGVDRTDSAVCGILCNADSLFNTITIEHSEESLLACVFQDNIIWSNKELSPQERIHILQMQNDGEKSREQEGWFERSMNYPDFDWSIRYCVPRDVILHNVDYFRNVMLLFVSLFLLLFLARIIITGSLYSRPFRKMVSEIENVRTDSARLSPSILKELDMVSDAVNHMLDELNHSYHRENDLQEKLYQSMLAQTRAQLYAYRLQINPHFLFNTMECMRSMAAYYGVSDLEQIISSLSELFRYTLHAPAVSTLEKEISHIRNYTTIMNLRGSQVIQVSYEIGEETTSFLLPSISLQPIVENCFRHAFKNKKTPCTPEIIVRSYIREAENLNLLIIEIEDNGAGIEADVLSRLNQDLKSGSEPERPGSIGLMNIYNRCRLMSELSDLTISSEPETFTRVTLSLPCTTDSLLYVTGSGT